MNANDLITIDPEILGGAPVFKGTRVPVEDSLRIFRERLLSGRIPGMLSFGKPRRGPSDSGTL
jgi:hypothetical protein